jgi:hypothetical protein
VWQVFHLELNGGAWQSGNRFVQQDGTMAIAEIDFSESYPVMGGNFDSAQRWVVRDHEFPISRPANVQLNGVGHGRCRGETGECVVGKTCWPPAVAHDQGPHAFPDDIEKSIYNGGSGQYISTGIPLASG